MAFRSLTIPIMIASPGDVELERDMVREVIAEWNSINSVSREIVLLAVGWDTHAAPELGGRAQEIINERLLKDCDLLVAIFWTKLGTPTGKAASGTVEEIERHLEAGKPAMVYFSATPVAPQSLDPEEYGKLQEFRDWCKGQGLIETFDSIDDFRIKFNRQFQTQLASHAYLSHLITNASSSATEPMTPTLSQEAKDLLIAAASSPDGYVLSLRMLGGSIIQTNGKSFGGEDARTQARWESALNQLVGEGYLMARGVKGETFQVTDKGYELVDRLAGQVT